MRKVEILPTRDSEAGYGPGHCHCHTSEKQTQNNNVCRDASQKMHITRSFNMGIMT